MAKRDHFRLGTGAGFSADRLDPAVDLVAKGRLDAIVFECIGERTLAFGHRDRMADPEAGYNPLLERRLRAVLPLCVEHGTRLVTNMGVANPRGAAAKTAQVARDLGLRGLRIAALEGDDVSAAIGADTSLPDSGMTVREVGRPPVGANAYLGADAILPALEAEADVVADFSRVDIREDGADRVAVGGATGRPRPDRLKVTVAFDGGLLAEAGVSYAGPGAKERAELAGAIVNERMIALHGCNAPLRIDLIGANALHGTARDYPSEAQDVRLRAALRADSREQAELLLWEVESLLCCGPAGGGGYRGRITTSVITHSAYIDRAQVHPRIELIET